MMPVQQGRIYSFGNLNWDTFNGLPGMLADSLPDTYGRALFDKWLTLTGRKTNSPVKSLCFLGERCMGALEFEPATSPASDANMKIEIDSLIDVARIKGASEIIEQVCETAALWSKLAKDCGVPQKMIDGIVPHMLLDL